MGTPTPAALDASLDALLRPATLSTLIKSLRSMADGCRANATGGVMELLTRQAVALDASATTLEWLQVPVANTTLAALAALPPDIQGMVSDVAVQLLEAGSSRHRLKLELRAALESRPSSTVRASCSVPTCTNTMPPGQVMCTRCWDRVPKSLRRDIDGAKFGSTRRHEKVRLAIASAQAVPS